MAGADLWAAVTHYAGVFAIGVMLGRLIAFFANNYEARKRRDAMRADVEARRQQERQAARLRPLPQWEEDEMEDWMDGQG